MHFTLYLTKFRTEVDGCIDDTVTIGVIPNQ